MASNCADSSSRYLNTQCLTLPDMSSKFFKPLDDVLRCRICDEYFNICMVTKCNHNYCSLCIRRSMSFKAQCPICFQAASEQELRNNEIIDDVLRAYLKLRETLQNPSSIARETPSVPSPVPTRIKEEPLSDDSYSHNVNEKTVSTDIDKVSCPVCCTTVPGSRINIHLDSCLKLKKKERESERKSLPKLVYYLLPDKEIRKKLKDFGLSSAGGREALIKRHRNFVILYNSNYDAPEPKPVEELVKEIEAQELEEKLNACSTQISVNKKSEISDIENELESYAKQHKSQFNNLINDIQQRQLDRTVVKQEVPDDYEEKDRRAVKQEIPDDYEETEHSKNVSKEESRLALNEENSNLNKEITPEPEESDGSSELHSPSLLGDLDTSKVSQLSLLRKRKKRRSVKGQVESPKKK